MANVNKISSSRTRKPRSAKNPKPDDLVLFHFEMTRHMRDDLDQYARARGVTASALVRTWIRVHLLNAGNGRLL